MDKKLLTVTEAHSSLGISRTALYALLRSGEVESVKIGRSRRIAPDALDRFVAALQDRSDTTVGSGR